MNPQQAKELLPIITAFAEGKKIQVRNKGTSAWLNSTSYSFDPDYCEYRIKPTHTFRPWKPEEVPVGAVIKFNEGRFLIIASNVNGTLAIMREKHDQVVWYANNSFISNVFSFDHGKTWLPCGVMEGE